MGENIALDEEELAFECLQRLTQFIETTAVITDNGPCRNSVNLGNFICHIGGNYALNAEGDEIAVIASVTIPEGKTVNLDLKGKTIVGELKSRSIVGEVTLNNAGELTISDSSTEQNGSVELAIVNSGKLAISGGTFVRNISGEGEFALTGGIYTQNVNDWCATGYAALPQPSRSA